MVKWEAVHEEELLINFNDKAKVHVVKESSEAMKHLTSKYILLHVRKAESSQGNHSPSNAIPCKEKSKKMKSDLWDKNWEYKQYPPHHFLSRLKNQKLDR